MPCFAAAAVYSGEQNGSNQMYYYRILNSVIITLPESVIEIGLDAFYGSIDLIIHAPAGRQLRSTTEEYYA